jgi:hypothetical protein
MYSREFRYRNGRVLEMLLRPRRTTSLLTVSHVVWRLSRITAPSTDRNYPETHIGVKEYKSAAVQKPVLQMALMDGF